jgi:hypothetical protein
MGTPGAEAGVSADGEDHFGRDGRADRPFARDSPDIEHFGPAHDVVELEAPEAIGMSRRSSTGRSARTGIVAPAGV